MGQETKPWKCVPDKHRHDSGQFRKQVVKMTEPLGSANGGGENFSRLCAIVVEVLDVDPAKLKPGSLFKEDLGADSLALIEIAEGVEAEFNISLNDEELGDIKSLENARELLEEKLAAQNAV